MVTDSSTQLLRSKRSTLNQDHDSGNDFKNEKHACVGFRTKGHAGMSEAGQDIVCAAASVLIINTVNAIDRYTSDETSLISDDEEGVIEFELPNSPSERAALLLDAMILGLESIADDENYEQYIDITFEEV